MCHYDYILLFSHNLLKRDHQGCYHYNRSLKITHNESFLNSNVCLLYTACNDNNAQTPHVDIF